MLFCSLNFQSNCTSLHDFIGKQATVLKKSVGKVSIQLTSALQRVTGMCGHLGGKKETTEHYLLDSKMHTPRFVISVKINK